MPDAHPVAHLATTGPRVTPGAATPGAVTLGECAGLTLLGELAPDLLARILARCTVAHYPAGALILARGAANQTLHFLLDGIVHIHFDLTDRSRPILVPPGRMFGEMSVIDGLPVSAFVLAAAPSRVLLVPAEIFWEEVVTAPGAARTVMRALSGLLRSNAAALTEALQERLAHEALGRELALARDIQMGMLKRADPWFPDQSSFAIAAWLEPAKLVGGDFYDAFLLDEHHLVVAIGDVAGKGISAALFMVRALTLLRSWAPDWRSLAGTAADVNNSLARDNEAGMFLSLFMAVLDLRTGVLDYVNHGHAPPVLRAPDGSARLQPVARGLVLGLIEHAKGGFGQLVLPPGATLLLYSDGVTEALDPDQALFGDDRLLAAVAAAPVADPAALVPAIAGAVAGFAGSAEQADDITLLALRWPGPPAS
jgi:sigma-B regulation protein RsbU (phosphoserine phosphatase)